MLAISSDVPRWVVQETATSRCFLGEKFYIMGKGCKYSTNDLIIYIDNLIITNKHKYNNNFLKILIY